MNDVKIMHVFQPTSDTLDLASKWKISDVADLMVNYEPTSVCQFQGSC